MKPVIAIAASESLSNSGDNQWISYTPKNFVTAIQKVGGLPQILPIGDPDDAQQYLAGCDKLLLAGGQDIDPRLYGEEPSPKLGEIAPARDAFELALIQQALKKQMPILAVCRGMQLVNVAFGGSLYQDLSQYPQSLKHNQLPTPFHIPTHEITITQDSRLAKILATKTYQVNSFHHQGIKKLAPDLRIVATATDGMVEALESDHYPLLAIQWHPEVTFATIASEEKIFAYFVNEL